MASTTSKRGLNKPARTDYVNAVTDLNDNWDNLDDAVPDSRTVNGHPLSDDVTVSKGDVGLGNVDNVQQVPATRKVNNKALSSDVTLYGSDIPMNSLDGTKLDAAISDTKSAVNECTGGNYIRNVNNDFEQGRLDGSGTEIESDTICRSKDYLWVRGFKRITYSIDSAYKIGMRWYGEDKSILPSGGSTGTASERDINMPSAAYYCRFLIQRSSGSSDLTPTEVSGLTLNIQFRSETYQRTEKNEANVSELSEELYNFIDADVTQSIAEDFEQGKINSDGTEDSTDLTRCKSNKHYDISVFERLIYSIDTDYQMVIIWYNKNKEKLTTSAGSASERDLTIPSTAYYCKFVIKLTEGGNLTPSTVAGLAIDINYKSKLQRYEGLNPEAVRNLKGKKIVCFGDSITGNFQSPLDYPSKIAEITGATVYNAGFGGCCMADVGQERNAFTMCRLADAIYSNDWDAQDSSGISITYNAPSETEDRWENTGINYVPDKIALLKSIDFNEIDIITISYGTNDWNSEVPIDNPSNKYDTATYLGAFRYAVQKLLERYPHLKIIPITPLWRFYYTNGGSYNDSDNWKNSTTNLYLYQYAEALAEACASYHFQFIELYYQSGFNTESRFNYFYDSYPDYVDGTHPNPNGLKALGEIVAKGIMNGSYSSLNAHKPFNATADRNTTYTQSGNFTLTKNNGVVVMTFAFKASASDPGTNILATVPLGYRPKTTIYTYGCAANSDGVARLKIGSNGNLVGASETYNKVVGGETYSGSVSWIV